MFHRLVWDLQSVRQVNYMKITNFHDFGGNISNGVRSIKIYVIQAYPSTVHNSNVTVADCIYSVEIPRYDHNKNFSVPLLSVLSGRYIILDTFSAWGNPPGWDRIGVRRVEISSSAVA